MFYRILTLILPLFLRVFFRRIYFSGLENLPKNKPIFLAANHSNSFLDGVIIASMLRRELHILARGDVFDKKWANFVLREMNLLPIYRKVDGSIRDNIRRNEELADRCYEIFKKNGMVLIFSESVAKCEKRLRPLKKGTARMAFDMEQRTGFQTGLHVVPTGVNYSFYGGYRMEVNVNFAPPIEMRQWKEEYAYSEGASVTEFTEQLDKQMKSQMVLIDNEDNDELVDCAIDIARMNQKRPFFEFYKRSDEQFLFEKKIAAAVNEELDQIDSTLKSKLSEYKDLTTKHKINELAFEPHRLRWYLWLLLPLGIPGWLLFGWTFRLAFSASKKIVRKFSFFDSVLFGISFVYNLLVCLIVFVVCLVAFGWLGFVAFALVIASGFAYLAWKTGLWNVLTAKRKLKAMKNESDLAYELLLKLRSEILSHEALSR